MIKLIEVKKTTNESNANLLRRFSKRVKGAGYIKKAKGLRYNERIKSDLKRKQDAIKQLKKRADTDRLKKLGKIKDGFNK